MNTERIKELAEQAGISLSQKDYSYYWVESAEDIEKFAELIVRECIQVVGLEDSDTEEWFQAKADSVKKIKQHFGVEK